jgi:tubulin polyglutamylase TTLL6/13
MRFSNRVHCQTSELQTYLNSKLRRTFIIKPDRGSLGKGIMLIRDADTIDNWSDLAIAQQYISPYLIDGLKFDLRIYALISSMEPLRIYLHNEGMARFCTEPYVKPAANNLELSFAHLTNYSLNKKSPNFEENVDAEHADRGHKRSMSSVFQKMEENGVNIDLMKQKIEDIIRLTIISVQPLVNTNYHTAIPWHDGKSRCFEVLGFDILIDKHTNPWLLEVNWAPSLATGSPFDMSIKKSVVTGALKIVNIQPNFKRIIEKRRKAISQGREIITEKFDINEELELAKSTQYQLIYPLTKDHPSYPNTELAFAESKTSTVGAAVQSAKVKARKETIMAQLKAAETPISIPKTPAPLAKPNQIPYRGLFPASRLITPIHKREQIKPRLMSVTQVLQPIGQKSFFDMFICLPGDVIDLQQENIRLKNLRKQYGVAQGLGLPERLAKLVTGAEGGRRPFLGTVRGHGMMRAIWPENLVL